MIDTFEPVDAQDARIARRVAGLLGAFNQAGVLTAADVHVARTLGDLAGETDERVLLAVALAGAAVRGGSVCLDLAATAAEPLPAPEQGEVPAAAPPAWPETDAWAEAVAGSRVVAAGLVRWEHGLVYLDRYHRQECQVRDDLLARAAGAPTVDADRVDATLGRVLRGAGYAEQAAAVRHAAVSWTTVLTGGPGTGKTTAVAGLLVTLAEQAAAEDRRLRIALAAPTGKAAARLQTSVVSSAADLDPRGDAGLAELRASTLHRLLRLLPGQRTRFRHDRRNRLPHDVVVVDEASMVSLTMMARLLEAVRPDARLVLVGDPDQLSSVDAGAVLTDLVAGFRERADDPVVTLATTHRYGAEIGTLASALREGDADAVVAALETGGAGGDAAGIDAAGDVGAGGAVIWVRDDDPTGRVRAAALPAALALRDAALAGDARRAVEALDRHRLLCAHREGPSGVRRWNRQVEQWLTDETGDPLLGPSYAGRPLLVTANDHALGLWNGDTGVLVAGDAGPRVALGTGAGGVRELAPSRLSDVLTMHAMTIHKSQGSQADEVTVVLPEEDSRLLTRELLYTAVTRARRTVRVVGSEAAVRAAVGRQARRASGLRQRLAGGAGGPPAPGE